MKILPLICLALLLSTSAKAQSYHLEIADGVFHLGINSRFAILCGPKSDIGLDNITVLQHSVESYLFDSINNSIILPLVEEYGWFKFRMRDDLPALFHIVINDGEVIDTLTYGAEPIPVRVYVGGAGSDDDAIKGIVLKPQRGLYAQIECCGFEARCAVLSYEVTVVSENGRKSSENEGGNFSETTANLIKTIVPGDVVMFRFISYRCPGADTSRQRAPDMVFTVK